MWRRVREHGTKSQKCLVGWLQGSPCSHMTGAPVQNPLFTRKIMKNDILQEPQTLIERENNEAVVTEPTEPNASLIRGHRLVGPTNSGVTWLSMNGENRLLVTYEPVEFEK